MAKVRVHELSKELGLDTKDVISYLAGKGVEAKAQSGIEEDVVNDVKKHFAKPAANTANAAATAAANANGEEKLRKPKLDENGNPIRKPKLDENGNPIAAPKKNVYVVTRGDRDNRRRRDDRGNGNREGGNRDNRDRRDSDRDNRQSRSNQPQQRIQVRSFEKGMRPSEMHSVKEEEFVAQPAASVKENDAPRHEKNAGNNKPQRNDRPDRPIRPRTDRPEGSRPSERVNREDRPARNDRGDRNGNDRPQRGDRPNRDGAPRGDRPMNKDRKFDGNKPMGGQRRDDNRNSAPAADGPSSKTNGRRDNNRKNKPVEHDNIGGKKQERFVNLEKNGGKKKKPQGPKAPERDMNELLTIVIPDTITIKDLADKMKVQASAVVKTLFMKGTMVTVNQEVDFEKASEIALEFNCICEEEEKVDVIAELLKEDEEAEETMVSRPPVVCVMGHVDHGKTSLLDAIRHTKVTAREAGGITQAIGAYMVEIGGRSITFLDTPGHEAFTAMRMRGASSTDIAILVVAADDGVMPQTVEAINHAKAAGVEIIVAINKVDKPNANIDRVKQELSEYELIPEDWGGSTIMVPVSAHTKEGIETLLEMVLLTADVLELKANPNRNARGLVIEAQLDKGRGAVATVLVQKGTLKVGDPVACGSCYGKVRAMIDDNGERVKTAGPSVPVEILGLSDVPNAGEVFMSFDSEKEAHTFADTFVAEGKNRLIDETKAKMSLDDLFSQIQSGNVKELKLIVKADVQGSVEALKQSLAKLSNDEVVVKTIHGGVGAINESDVVLASASNAIIIGFNVRPDVQAKATADREGVDIRLYKVIYNAIEDIEAAMKGMLDPIFEEKVIGHAEVRQIFKASGIGNIAGSYVTDGYFQRDCGVRVYREGSLIHEGKLGSLKRFKDDVKEVKSNFECGIVVDDFNDYAEFDTIEAFIMVEVPR